MSLSSKNWVNMRNQAISSMRGLIECSSNSSVTNVFGSIHINEKIAWEGGVPTESSRNDCTAWEAGVLKIQTFEDSIKLKADWRQRPQEVEDVCKGITKCDLDILKRRPPPSRGIWGKKQAVTEEKPASWRRTGMRVHFGSQIDSWVQTDFEVIKNRRMGIIEQGCSIFQKATSKGFSEL